jgi:hypothetical protein
VLAIRVLFKLGHRPLGKRQSQIRRTSQGSSDELADLSAGKRRGASFRIGNVFKSGKALVVKTMNPVVDHGKVNTHSIGDFPGVPTPGSFRNNAVTFIDTDRKSLISELLLEQTTFIGLKGA